MGYRKDSKYIHAFAEKVAQQLGIEPEVELDGSLQVSASDWATRLVFEYQAKILEHLRLNCSDATYGRVASCGLGVHTREAQEDITPKGETVLRLVGVTLWEVAGEDWPGRQNACLDQPRDVVMRIASLVIIAAMADNIWATLHKQVA